MSEEHKAAPLVFRHDQMVIVYDDMSPRADDLCNLATRERPSAAEVKEFGGLVNDFAKLINVIGRYHYQRPHQGQHDADLQAIPLSQWLAVHRDPDQHPTIHNTPLDVVFILFFHYPQVKPDPLYESFYPMYSSQSVTRIVLEESARVASSHTYNIVPGPPRQPTRLEYVHIPIVCLSKWAGHYDNHHGVLPRFNGLTSRLSNEPLPGQDRYQFPLTHETTALHLGVLRALENAEYRRKVVEKRLLHNIFRYAYFPYYRAWNKEAAALSSVISHGLVDRSTAWGHAVRGYVLYDPRIFLHVWYALTGDTAPKPQEKHKHKDDE